MKCISGELSQTAHSIDGVVSGQAKVSGNVTMPTGGMNYSGDYEFTPTEEEQTIDIGGLKAKSNIVIKAIPSNYGRVSWNGTTLSIT